MIWRGPAGMVKLKKMSLPLVQPHVPEVLFTAMYPAMHMFYPVWQKVLNSADINPAEAAWINEQMELAEAQGKQLYDETPTDEVYDEKHEK